MLVTVVIPTNQKSCCSKKYQGNLQNEPYFSLNNIVLIGNMTRAIIIEDEKRSSDELSHLVTKYCSNIKIISVAQIAQSASKIINL